MREREADYITARRDRDVLDPVDRVTHRGSAHGLAGVELPEGVAGPRPNRFESSGIVSKEHQVTRRGHCPAPRIASSNLGIAPHNLSLGQRIRQQNLLSVVIGCKLRAGIVKSLALDKCLRVSKKDAATLQRHEVEKSGNGIVRRRKPIRSSVDARTDLRALGAGYFS